MRVPMYLPKKLPRKLKKKIKTSMRFRVDYLIRFIEYLRRKKILLRYADGSEEWLTNENFNEEELAALKEWRKQLSKKDLRPECFLKEYKNEINFISLQHETTKETEERP